MDLRRVKERINYIGPTTPTLEVLTELQYRFLLSVPFENLDIHLGIPMDFSSEGIFDKIINRNRGGLCFENNSLFYDILTFLGFRVNFVGAEMYQKKPFTGTINHMALLVELDGESYLVDVGNGKAFGRPLPLNNSEWSQGEDALYKVEDFQGLKALIFKDVNGDLQPRYRFDKSALKREDFVEPSIYTQTSPDSIFTQKTLVSLFKENGRITLTNSKVLLTNKGEQKVSSLSTTREYQSFLEEKFNINIELEQLKKLFNRIIQLTEI